jgi:hypothetical protein
MINLVVTLILICGSLGAVISKTTKEYGVKKQREHTEPLNIGRNILS